MLLLQNAYSVTTMRQTNVEIEEVEVIPVTIGTYVCTYFITGSRVIQYKLSGRSERKLCKTYTQTGFFLFSLSLATCRWVGCAVFVHIKEPHPMVLTYTVGQVTSSAYKRESWSASRESLVVKERSFGFCSAVLSHRR